MSTSARREDEELCCGLARLAVLEERARIARELHDDIAHYMTLTVVRAEAALLRIPDMTDATRQVLEVVRDAAHAALTETRRVVGMLRGEGIEHAQRLSLDHLDELTGAARDTGLRLSTAVIGVPRPLDTSVDSAAFRVVQESLSNAVRYAPGARVTVEIRYRPEALRVSITDDGARSAPGTPRGGGHGLAGMYERVALLDGTLQAGPRDGTGWLVVADLPYAAPRGPRHNHRCAYGSAGAAGPRT